MFQGYVCYVPIVPKSEAPETKKTALRRMACERMWEAEQQSPPAF